MFSFKVYCPVLLSIEGKFSFKTRSLTPMVFNLSISLQLLQISTDRNNT